MPEVRVRFAPSPTGFLHIGGLRTALYDFLFARKHNGKFILRIEDTDRNRLVEGAVENLISSLERLGLHIDEGPSVGGDFGPYIQSERLDLYHEHARELLDKGLAYRCFCSPETLEQMRLQQQERKEFVKYDRRCLALTPAEIEANIQAGKPSVLRLAMPQERKFRFFDQIRGEVEMDASQSDDQVLLKADGFPTYHLAAVVDDHFMKISHVIRGEEWLSSTPKHIYLYECFGWESPVWVHLPLILNPDRSKLSKRMNDVSVESYLEKGYLKQALLNFIALLGWHAADDRELYSLDELCEVFSLERVSKSGAVFDLTKLNWMNAHYLRDLPLEEIAEECKRYFDALALDTSDECKYLKAVEIARQRVNLLPEIAEYCQMFYQINPLCPEDEQIIQGVEGQAVINWFLQEIPQRFPLDTEKITVMVNSAIADLNIKGKKFYTPLRLALLGQAHGPDLPSSFDVLGVEEVIIRLKQAQRS